MRIADQGHCGQTDVASSVQAEEAHCCSAGRGSFKWPAAGKLRTLEGATKWCLDRASKCPEARYISVSLKYRDCSWYSRCPQLFAGPDGSKASFVSAAFNTTSAKCPTPSATNQSSPAGSEDVGRPLDLPTLNRSLLELGRSQAWIPLFSRLASRAPITLAILGSSVAQNAGCLAQPYARCAKYASGAARGFAVRFLERINISWPHAQHTIFSGGRDAMPLSPSCLFAHMPAHADLVVIEFGSMAKFVPLANVEKVVRMLLAQDPPPFVILLSVHQWCSRPGGARRELLSHATTGCESSAGRGCTPWSALEAETRRVCNRYGVACVSVYQGLFPRVVTGEMPLERLTTDCLHFSTSRPRGSGPQMVSDMLSHWFEQAQALWLQLHNRVSVSAHAPWEAIRPLGLLPPPLHAENAAAQSPTRCYAFTRDEGQAAADGTLSIQLKRPIRWATRAVCRGKQECDHLYSDAAASCPVEGSSRGAFDEFLRDPPAGWFFCGLSLPTGTRLEGLDASAVLRRKISPGVLALVPGATLRAEVDPDVGQPKGRAGGLVRMAISYLTSYEGMGKAAVSCRAACSCDQTVIDAHRDTKAGARKESVFETASLEVASHAHGACHLVIELLTSTSSGQHKFKVRDLVVTAL